MFQRNRNFVIRFGLIVAILGAMFASAVANVVTTVQQEIASEQQALVPMQKVCAAAHPAADNQADLSCAADLVSSPYCVMLTKKVMAPAAFQHSGLILTQGDADLRCNNTTAFAFDQQQGQAEEPIQVTITSSTKSPTQVVVPICANPTAFIASRCDPSLIVPAHSPQP